MNCLTRDEAHRRYIYTRRNDVPVLQGNCAAQVNITNTYNMKLHSILSVISVGTLYACIPFIEGGILRGAVLIQGLQSRLANQS